MWPFGPGSPGLWKWKVGLFLRRKLGAQVAAPEEVHGPAPGAPAQPGSELPARPGLTPLQERAAEVQDLERAARSREGRVGDARAGVAAQLRAGEIEEAQRGEAGEGPGLQRPQRVPGERQRAEAGQRGPRARRQRGQQVVAEVQRVQRGRPAGAPAQRIDAVVAQRQHLQPRQGRELGGAQGAQQVVAAVQAAQRGRQAAWQALQAAVREAQGRASLGGQPLAGRARGVAGAALPGVLPSQPEKKAPLLGGPCPGRAQRRGQQQRQRQQSPPHGAWLGREQRDSPFNPQQPRNEGEMCPLLSRSEEKHRP